MLFSFLHLFLDIALFTIYRARFHSQTNIVILRAAYDHLSKKESQQTPSPHQ